jgi:hypothetical protein
VQHLTGLCLKVVVLRVNIIVIDFPCAAIAAKPDMPVAGTGAE